MTHEITLIRQTHPDDGDRKMVTGARITGLSEEFFGDSEAELLVEETEDGQFVAESEMGETELSTVVDAVLSSLGEFWSGHPVPSEADGAEFVLVDGDERQEFVARQGMVIRKENDWM